MDHLYTFQVKEIEKITDGDTYWLHLDVGFRQSMLAHLRLNAWDTPELRRGSEFEKEQGRKAKNLAGFWIQVGVEERSLWVQTQKDPDNFGRWLGDFWRVVQRAGGAEEISLAQHLASFDLATPWPTRWREVYDPQPS